MPAVPTKSEVERLKKQKVKLKKELQKTCSMEKQLERKEHRLEKELKNVTCKLK
jgi:hypothetical protein